MHAALPAARLLPQLLLAPLPAVALHLLLLLFAAAVAADLNCCASRLRPEPRIVNTANSVQDQVRLP